jgi:hypothetical protein
VTYTPIERGSSDWDVPLNAALVDQDGRITSNAGSIGTQGTQITNLESLTTTQGSNITALQTATATLDWQPQDMNMKAWTQDPAGCGSTGSASTSGVMYLSRVILRSAATISNLYYTVATAGVTLTAGQNWCGLYNSTGTKLAEGPDQTTPMTSLGTKTVAITPQNLAAGSYYIALLTNGTTPPQFMRGNGASGSALNVGLTVSTGRFLDYGTGQTTLPATATLSSAAFNAAARWGAMN